LSTMNLVEISSSLVEFLIPLTIVTTAVANLFQRNFTNKTIRINYFLALFFGLIHGLGFANTLRFILAEDQNLGWALFGFNVGLEAGQIIVVLIILLLAELTIRILKVNRRDWVLFISAGTFALALKMALERIPGNHS
ncbi:MAG TPA: HupE/UreJ family protein, partial [Chitinophagaceae bacterium]